MEDITGLRTVTNMWKHCFDYTGTASRKEYWIPFAIHAGLGMLAGLLAIIALMISQTGGSRVAAGICEIPALVLTLYLVASILPWISLTVRRLHDTGKSGWWTFLLLAVGIGTLIVIFLCSMAAGVSTFRPINNSPEGIYGPPEILQPYDPSNNIEPDVYGPPPFEPEENEVPTVYGPPEFDDYDPSDNVEEEVYGPPDMYNEGKLNIYDQDEIEIYVPEDNMEPTVYGPPDMMN